MPTPSLSELANNPSQKQVVDYIVKLQRDLEWLLLNLDDLNVRRVHADTVYTGTLDANVVTIRSDLTSGYIQIDGNGLVINNGSFNTFTADINGKVTMTSALIKSSTGYPYVTIDPAGDLFGAYLTPSDFLSIYPAGIDGYNVPVMKFSGNGNNSYIFYDPTTDQLNMTSNDANIVLSTNGYLGLFAAGKTKIQTWDFLQNNSSSKTLQDELDDIYIQLDNKATSGASTGSSGPFNGGIPIGTELMTADGGTVTWVGIASHSHTQN